MSRVLTDSLTHAYAKCEKPSFWMTSNVHFKSQFHLFINQNIFGLYITMIILYSKFMCLFMGSGFLVSHHGLGKPKHFYDLSLLGTMSNHNWRVFHSRGDLSLLANTRHMFSVSCNRETLLDIVPFTEPTQSNTKRNVNLPTTHSHQ